jgi:acetylornithine deacetylase/succinyl-diaminopimelate desuccinylase-like protein
VRGKTVHVADAGTGANAIKAAYHLMHALEGLEEEWNARAKTDRNYRAVNHPINFNPGIIRGGDWASSVPAWCDLECRLAVLPGWSVKACQEEIVACINAAARQHAFLDRNKPVVEWSGFQCEGYELTRPSRRLLCSGAMMRSMAASFPSVPSPQRPTRAITGSTRKCRASASAPAPTASTASTKASICRRCARRPVRSRCSSPIGAASKRSE